MTSKMRGLWSRRHLLYLAVIVFGLVLGVYVSSRQITPGYEYAQLLPAAKKIPAFNLHNQQGNPLTPELWRGRWSLVFFGFTSCPDICPLELQKLGKLLREMGEGSGLQIVFVSVDPERDSLEKLGDYVHFFHPDIIALSGANTELARTAQFFGAAYDRSVIIDGKLLKVPWGIDMPQGSDEHYQVSHSTRVFIINPQGEYTGSFAPPFAGADLAADMKKMLQH